jgi:hypothetical protein
VALDTRDTEYQGFVDLDGFLQHRADPGRRLASEAELVKRVGRWLGKRTSAAGMRAATYAVISVSNATLRSPPCSRFDPAILTNW